MFHEVPDNPPCYECIFLETQQFPVLHRRLQHLPSSPFALEVQLDQIKQQLPTYFAVQPRGMELPVIV